MSYNPFAEPFKSFESFAQQVPSFDFNEYAQLARKNAEAFIAASQIVTEAAQNIARRQLEIAQSNAESALDLFKEIVSSKDPREAAAKQMAFAESAFKRTAQDANELSEIASKSGNKALDVVSKQVTESFKEFSKAAQPKPNQPKKAA